MDFLNYIAEKVLYLIPALWILGQFLKGIPKFPDWGIVFALLAFGITLSCLILGISADSVVQGVLVTGAAVLGNQAVKQIQKAVNGDN